VASSLASQLAPAHQQGSVLGVVQSSGGLARVVGPVWSGFLYTHLGPAAPFASGVAAALFSLLVGVGLRAQLEAHRSMSASPLPLGEGQGEGR
jgi:MFS family permease